MRNVESGGPPTIGTSMPQVLLEEICQKMPLGVVVQDKDGHICATNPAALEILGITEVEAPTRTSESAEWNAVHEDGSPFPGDQHPAMLTLATGEPVTGVIMGLGEIGARRWIEVSTFPVDGDGDGVANGVCSTFVDVTERQESVRHRETLLDRLADRAEEFTAVVESAPDGILMCGSDGTIVLVNEKLCELLQYEPSELVGSQVERLVPLAVRQRHESHRRGYESAPTRRAMTGIDALVALRSDGSEVPVEISLSPVHFDHRRLTIAAVRDVSAHRRNEAALRRAETRLAVAEERERIARDLHDTVIQELFAIGMSLQAAMALPDDILIERVDTAVISLDAAIRDVRTAIFQIGHGAIPPEAHASTEIEAMLAESGRVLGFTPELRVHGDIDVLPPEVVDELLPSLREIVTNAARHADATSLIVDLTADDQITVRVTDNGIGVPHGSDNTTSGGHGLRNLSARAVRLGGSFTLSAGDEKGSVAEWCVPLVKPLSDR